MEKSKKQNFKRFSGQNRKNKTLYYIKVLTTKIEKTKLYYFFNKTKIYLLLILYKSFSDQNQKIKF